MPDDIKAEGRRLAANQGTGAPQSAAARRRVLLIAFAVAAFFVRGLFYCVLQPLWEGYDEWAHFAYIQHIAEEGRLPARNDPVSQEVRRSLELAPLAYSPRRLSIGTMHDEFWRLSPEERHVRERELLRLRSLRQAPAGGPGSVSQYEAQQPPLYYLILSLPYLMARAASLPAQVLLLRGLSLVMALPLIPLGYAVAKRLFASDRMASILVLLLACLPGLYIDLCRVGNESLSLVLASVVVLCCLRLLVRDAALRDWLMLGAALGAALLTKAYALALLPLVPFVAGVRSIRFTQRRMETIKGSALALALPVVMSGWWYWQNWRVTGTLSGQQIDAAATRFSLGRKIAAIADVRWSRVLDATAYSHIWVSGWSFVVVRSWIYRIFEVIALIALFGLLVLGGRLVARARRRRAAGPLGVRLALVASAFLLLCATLAYHSVIVYVAEGAFMGPGWYLYAVVVCEVALLGWGFVAVFGSRWGPATLAAVSALALALDLYTVNFVLVPYYTGLIGHRLSGSIENFHFAAVGAAGGLGELLRRLAVNRPSSCGPAVLILMWAAYVSATVAIGARVAALALGPLITKFRSRTVSAKRLSI